MGSEIIIWDDHSTMADGLVEKAERFGYKVNRRFTGMTEPVVNLYGEFFQGYRNVRYVLFCGRTSPK